MQDSIYHMALKSKRQDFAISQRITLPSNVYLIKKYSNRDLLLLTHGVGGQIAQY